MKRISLISTLTLGALLLSSLSYASVVKAYRYDQGPIAVDFYYKSILSNNTNDTITMTLKDKNGGKAYFSSTNVTLQPHQKVYSDIVWHAVTTKGGYTTGDDCSISLNNYMPLSNTYFFGVGRNSGKLNGDLFFQDGAIINYPQYSLSTTQNNEYIQFTLNSNTTSH